MSSPLRDAVVRRFVVGQTVWHCGAWTVRVAQSWLVLHTPGGGTGAVGVVVGLQFLPLLVLGLWTGALCDRYPKRLMLGCARGTTALLGAGLVGCAAYGAGTHVVYGFALAQGLATAVERPASESLLGEAVDARLLHGAVALNGAAFNVGRMVGPALAGVSIAWRGVPSTMAAGTALLLAALPMLPHARHRAGPGTGVTGADGSAGAVLRRVRRDSNLTGVLALVALVSAFGLNFQITCVAMADGAFHRSAASYGAGLTALAVGALTGAALTVRLGRPRSRRVAYAAFVFGALETLCALAPTFPVFIAVLVAVGASMAHFTASARSYVQHRVDDDVRGRVMGLYQMAALGTTPLAAPLIGWISAALSPRAGMLAGGLVSVLCAVALAPRLERAAVFFGVSSCAGDGTRPDRPACPKCG